ncbi:MAG: hypothetical protein WDO56_03935 [Gammaproteobacteria bacterium]
MNIVDLTERRQLREIAKRLDAVEAENRALKLDLDPLLRSRVALARVVEFQDRFAGLLKHIREPLAEAISWAVAEQIARGDEPDYKLAVALVLSDGARFLERVPRAQAAIAGEYARLSSVYKDF